MVKYISKADEWFDFMGGNEPYKGQWADDSYDIYKYISFESALSYRMYGAWLCLRHKLKSIKDKSSAVSKIWIFVSKLKD